jgi:HK97 family phage prohead protease
MKHRFLTTEIKTRSEDGEGDLFVEGYFAVYGAVYEIWPGATESIRAGAFAESISGDVRALYNHNMDIILGRSSSKTLELKDDNYGLWGRIKINRADTDAMNAYQRIQRGDITGCSFGFEVEEEETDYRKDGTVHWTLTKINPLYEISPCVFPAYQDTTISARQKDFNELQKRKTEFWKQTMKERFKKWH